MEVGGGGRVVRVYTNRQLRRYSSPYRLKNDLQAGGPAWPNGRAVPANRIQIVLKIGQLKRLSTRVSTEFTRLNAPDD